MAEGLLCFAFPTFPSPLSQLVNAGELLLLSPSYRSRHGGSEKRKKRSPLQKCTQLSQGFESGLSDARAQALAFPLSKSLIYGEISFSSAGVGNPCNNSEIRPFYEC